MKKRRKLEANSRAGERITVNGEREGKKREGKSILPYIRDTPPKIDTRIFKENEM